LKNWQVKLLLGYNLILSSLNICCGNEADLNISLKLAFFGQKKKTFMFLVAYKTTAVL